jgi:hypothetical protein
MEFHSYARQCAREGGRGGGARHRALHFLLYAHEIGFGGCRDFRLCLDETEGGRQVENSIRA